MSAVYKETRIPSAYRQYSIIVRMIAHVVYPRKKIVLKLWSLEEEREAKRGSEKEGKLSKCKYIVFNFVNLIDTNHTLYFLSVIRVATQNLHIIIAIYILPILLPISNSSRADSKSSTAYTLR